MTRETATTERLSTLLDKLRRLTSDGTISWERQSGSSHRYARWKEKLLIIGPHTSVDASDDRIRYLFLTRIDSPLSLEISSADPDLGEGLTSLIDAVETATAHKPPTDPFAVNAAILEELTD
jgi:hypothetical protein